MSEDDEITVKLSLKQWRMVVGHVEGGIYRDVQATLVSMYAQVNAEIGAANERAIAAAVAAEIRTAQAAQTAQGPFTGGTAPQPKDPYEQPTEPTQEPIADESGDSQSRTQRPALH